MSTITLQPPPLLWVDVETTGLDPETNSLLEVGAVFTDPSLKEIDWFNVVIHNHGIYEGGSQHGIPAQVLEMHTDNGLLKACGSLDTSTALRQAEEEFCIWLVHLPLLEGEDMYQFHPVSGSLPSFDKRWLEVHMPLSSRLLHYRVFDLNSVRMFLGVNKDKEGEPSVHRALPDIRRDIRHLKEFYNFVRDRMEA